MLSDETFAFHTETKKTYHSLCLQAPCKQCI